MVIGEDPGFSLLVVPPMQAGMRGCQDAIFTKTAWNWETFVHGAGGGGTRTQFSSMVMHSQFVINSFLGRKCIFIFNANLKLTLVNSNITAIIKCKAVSDIDLG